MSLTRGFYRIGAPQVKVLPIAILDNEDRIINIEKLVDKLQELMVISDESDPNVKELMQAIDLEVYDAYGLSKQEIRCIEGDQALI